jgi:hypothetical protein
MNNRSIEQELLPANRSIEQELVLPLWYADLHPGDAVTVATLSISWGEAQRRRSPSVAALERRYARGYGWSVVGYTDVAVRVRVAASSYGSFSLNVTST